MMANANKLVRDAGLTPEWSHSVDTTFLRIRRYTDGKTVPLGGLAFPADPGRRPRRVEIAMARLVEILEAFDDA
jgi:hypothetical protein